MIHKLKIKVDIDRIRDYYQTLVNEYQHLRWDQYKEADYLIPEWQVPGTASFISGWGIDSNLDDLNIPCPPYNISSRSKSYTTYRNTVLAFGIINELQNMFPYSDKWSIAVQGPGGFVGKHRDSLDKLTILIPIYNPPKAGWIMHENEKETDYHLSDDGSLYLVDTKIYHSTYNNDTVDRVIMTCRIPNECINDEILK